MILRLHESSRNPNTTPTPSKRYAKYELNATHRQFFYVVLAKGAHIGVHFHFPSPQSCHHCTTEGPYLILPPNSDMCWFQFICPPRIPFPGTSCAHYAPHTNKILQYSARAFSSFLRSFLPQYSSTVQISSYRLSPRVEIVPRRTRTTNGKRTNSWGLVTPNCNFLTRRRRAAE